MKTKKSGFCSLLFALGFSLLALMTDYDDLLFRLSIFNQPLAMHGQKNVYDMCMLPVNKC